MDNTTIEQIPADTELQMTQIWHRAFNAAGCNPMCHCCAKMLPENSRFKLSTVERLPRKRYDTGYAVTSQFMILDEDAKVTSKEVMLCEDCTPEMYLILQKKLLKSNKREADRLLKKHIANGGGCLRINGKIVH